MKDSGNTIVSTGSGDHQAKTTSCIRNAQKYALSQPSLQSGVLAATPTSPAVPDSEHSSSSIGPPSSVVGYHSTTGSSYQDLDEILN